MALDNFDKLDKKGWNAERPQREKENKVVGSDRSAMDAGIDRVYAPRILYNWKWGHLRGFFFQLFLNQLLRSNQD